MNQEINKHIVEVPIEVIIGQIFFIRGEKVILDKDLAKLYGVKTGVLNQAVKRKYKRFPSDFMFQLKKEEVINLKSQFVITSWGGSRQNPYVFTEQGVAMLSSVLSSNRAIEVNIQIIRTFIKLRRLAINNKELWKKVEMMEKRYNRELEDIFKILRSFLIQEEKEKEEIGFK